MPPGPDGPMQVPFTKPYPGPWEPAFGCLEGTSENLHSGAIWGLSVSVSVCRCVDLWCVCVLLCWGVWWFGCFGGWSTGARHAGKSSDKEDDSTKYDALLSIVSMTSCQIGRLPSCVRLAASLSRCLGGYAARGSSRTSPSTCQRQQACQRRRAFKHRRAPVFRPLVRAKLHGPS